ncbi:ankyrin repeat-containing domain protein [Chaetomium sp. MPI-SDFR-AT-0129]|nr:ankyrin repeat-containing domain protein [Chaetomium sp. MPI-SDFR-AT-0129]
MAPPSVRHRSHRSWQPSPALTSWTIQEEPSNRVSWTPPHVQTRTARPKRLRKSECREIPGPDGLPSIQIHGSGCRCAQAGNNEPSRKQSQDSILAAQISALTKSVLSSRIAESVPSPARPSPNRLRRSRSLSTSRLPNLSRIFSPSPSPPTTTTAPSLALQADLCIACTFFDITKVAHYLLPTILPSLNHPHSPTSSSPGALATPPPVHINAPNHIGITPLMATIRSPTAGPQTPLAQLAMVRFLVEACGADVNATRVDPATGRGESVLSMAVLVGAVGVVRYLVREAGVDVRRVLPEGGKGKNTSTPGRNGYGYNGYRFRPGKGQTALHVAVLSDRAECVEVLVREGGADVDGVVEGVLGDGDGVGGVGGLRGFKGGRKVRNPVSALHLAHGNYACTRVLLELGARVNVQDGYGRTPLYWAAEAGCAEVVRLLLAAGADMNLGSYEEITPLGAVVAAMEDTGETRGRIDVMRLLLQGGVTNRG